LYLSEITDKKSLRKALPWIALALPLVWGFVISFGPVTADNSLPIDHNEPMDRRVIQLVTCASERMSAEQLAAKRLEAASMLRWFKAKMRVYETELKQHAIEAEFNKQILERLKGIAGAIPEKNILELEKKIAVDALDTEQLQAYVEMAKADIDAASARVEFLKGECR